MEPMSKRILEVNPEFEMILGEEKVKYRLEKDVWYYEEEYS